MKKKILSLALALSTFTVSAFAEQPAAEEYKKTLQSGTYYVEYELNYAKKILAVQNSKRMDYTIYKKNGNMALGLALSLVNPLLFVASMFAGGDSKIPTALYQDGKYYQFNGKKNAIMAYWNQLDDPNLKPMEAWNSVKYRLALPEEFSIFSTNDPFYQELFRGVKPVFVESGKKVEKNKEILYDKYSIAERSVDGNVLFEKIYYAYYEDNKLKKMASYLKFVGGEEQLVRTLKVINVKAELPENALKIPKGCKVYAAGIGDMNDLIEQPVLVETY